jgi:hypothetical protein
MPAQKMAALPFSSAAHQQLPGAKKQQDNFQDPNNIVKTEELHD